MSLPVLNSVETQLAMPRSFDAVLAAPGRDDGPLVIGVDLGGTKLLGAIAGLDGHVLAEREFATGPAGPVTQVVELARTLLADSGVPLERLAQVVVGVPGVVDVHGGVSLSPHVPFAPGAPFAAAVSQALGVPAFADNDANIAAFGEYSTASQPDPSGVVLLTLGTGIGMGIVVNGAILRGAHGAAGEIGSMPYAIGGRGGLHPHYEALVSTAGIVAAHRAAGGRHGSVRDIFNAADRGDSAARIAVDHCIADLAHGLGVVVSLLDPGLIVLGGGIGARPGVAAAVAGRLTELVPTPCAVVASRLGTRAGLVGALALASRLVASSATTPREAAA